MKPNPDSENGTSGIDAVFGRAEDASNVNDNEREQIRRVITMVRYSKICLSTSLFLISQKKFFFVFFR